MGLSLITADLAKFQSYLFLAKEIILFCQHITMENCVDGKKGFEELENNSKVIASTSSSKALLSRVLVALQPKLNIKN